MAISGELDAAAAPEVRRAIATAMVAGGVIAVDLTGVTFADPEGVAALIAVRGPKAGSRFVLDRPVTRAGRHPDSDIFLDDVTVSRNHALLVKRLDTSRAGLLALPDDTVVLPGHMDQTTIGFERQHNPFILEWLRGHA